MDRPADWALISKYLLGKILCNEANLVVFLHVVRIEISSLHDDEMSNVLITLRDTGESYGMLYAVDYYLRVNVSRACNLHYAGNSVSNRLHVSERNFITERSGFAEGVYRAGVNDIRADAFNLPDDELTTGKRNGDDKHDTRAADNHTKHRKKRAKLIRTERVNGDEDCFTSYHYFNASTYWIPASALRVPSLAPLKTALAHVNSTLAPIRIQAFACSRGRICFSAPSSGPCGTDRLRHSAGPAYRKCAPANYGHRRA